MKRLVIFVLLALAGCSSSDTPSCVNGTIPASISFSWAQALAKAQACVARHGFPTELKCVPDIVLMPGERKARNGWGWYDQRWDRYVCGLSGKRGDVWTVWVGVDPKSLKGWDAGVLYHEALHQVRMQTVNDWGHNSVFADCGAPDWNDPPVNCMASSPWPCTVQFLELEGDFSIRDDGSPVPAPHYTNEPIIYGVP